MFNSGIKTADLITELENEVDVSLPIPIISYINWLNAVEQIVYSEIVQEQKEFIADIDESNKVVLDSINVSENEAIIRFEDIHAVYSDKVQLIYTNLASGSIFGDCYYKDNNNLAVKTDGESVRVIYIVRPRIKTEENPGNIMLPIEFIELAKSRLRAEAYKLMNENVLAANWINDYNVLLETFKTWLNSKKAVFGL